MMNNKGQSLILFILLIPVCFLLIISVYEIGKLVLIKGELDNICNIALDYGLDNLDDEDIQSKISDLIYKNNSNIDVVGIIVNDNKIYINLEDKIDDKMLLIGKFNGSLVKVSYVGYIDNEKKIIERNN